MANNKTNRELLIRIDERVIAIRKDINELKECLETKANKEDFENLRKEVSNIKLASILVGAFGGVLSAVAAVFGFKKLQ